MKQFLSAVLFMMILLPVVHAQREFYGRPVRLGFKIDPVFINNLSPKENGIDKAGSGMGINYGLMADFMFRDGRGAFASGIEVAHASSRLDYNGNTGLYGKGEYKINLQYIQIPLSVKLKTNEYNGMRWWGQFGTYMAPLLGARVDYTPGSGSTASAVSNKQIMKETNHLNLGLLVGAGGEYRLAPRTDLFYGIGFENGFTDITTNSKWNNDGKVVLNRWAMRLGMFF